MDELLQALCLSAKRALEGQTPPTLRAHFGETPSPHDLEDISVVETEIDADFLDHLEGETDTEVVPPGTALSFLSGGIAYLRGGEPGQVCHT